MIRGVAICVAVAVGIGVAVPTARADCNLPFGERADAVVDLHLRMPRATWDALRFDEPVGTDCEAQYPYHQVEFRCGDAEPWITIGVRHKRGDQRGRDTDEKPPLKLDFNRYVQGQRWPTHLGSLGFRKLSLNNGMPDNPGGTLSALLTELLAWRAIHAEVPTASRAAYARLTLHVADEGATELHGLYILIEDVDRTALRARFGDAADVGTLVKTTTGACRDEVEFDDGPPNQAADGIATWLGLDPAAFPDAWAARTDAALDLEELLRHEAARDVLANRDDTVLGVNYSNYVAFDPRVGRRHYLPWDLDDTFGPYPQDTPADTPLSSSCSPIGERTRCHPEIRARYLAIACQLVNGTLAAERLTADLAALDAFVRPIVAAETPLVWPHIDPLDPQITGTYAWQYDYETTWIPERIAFVRAAIEAEGVACPDGCEPGTTEPCSRLHCAGERRCEAGRWTTCTIDAVEVPGNGVDDDCDLELDEGGGDPGGGDDGPGGETPGGGCCGGAPAPGGALLLAIALLGVSRRRRGLRPRA